MTGRGKRGKGDGEGRVDAPIKTGHLDHPYYTHSLIQNGMYVQQTTVLTSTLNSVLHCQMSSIVFYCPTSMQIKINYSRPT